MTWHLDARIPVFLFPDDGALDAALAEGKPAAVLRFSAGQAPHAVACACCEGRGEAAQALDRLFQGRVRGTVPWFNRVLVLDEGCAGEEVRQAVAGDRVAAARYRLG
ncbi:hypothetical protein [Roseococcus sp. YIM B11640]|uniref:hypothetical protein n=1 Tax=Roseococcus sp. YIM B11640 TaxID=3133973 RepID=UPI003C7AE8A5